LRRGIAVAAVMVALLSGSPSWAYQAELAPPAITEAERAEQEKEAGKKPFPLGGNVSLTQSLGAGTFVEDEYVRRSAYDVSLSLNPYWRITSMMRLSAGLSISKAIVENYDSSATYKRRTLLSDVSLALNHFRLWEIPKTGIRLSGSISFSFPTSPQSRYRRLYFSSRANVGLSKAIGPVYLSYSLGFFKNFNQYTTPAVSTSDVGDHVILAHFEGNEQLTTDLVATGGANTSFGLLNMFLVSWNITDRLSLALMYNINNSWTYTSYPKDELSSPYAEAGRGQRDSHGGVIDISYQIKDYLSVSLGSETFVAPKSADNKSFVFPFLNLSNNSRNNTYFYLSVTGTY